VWNFARQLNRQQEILARPRWIAQQPTQECATSGLLVFGLPRAAIVLGLAEVPSVVGASQIPLQRCFPQSFVAVVAIEEHFPL
jgi:hypothetical protein